MNKRWDVQSIFDVGTLVVKVTMLAVIVMEFLSLMAGVMVLVFPPENAADPAVVAEMGNLFSTVFYGVGNVVMLVLAHRYFKNVSAVGTPFTYAGAAEVKRMAIVCAACNGAALLACYILDLGLRITVPEARMTHYDGLVLAAILFVASYVLDYGAKQEEKLEQYRKRITQLQMGSKEE